MSPDGNPKATSKAQFLKVLFSEFMEKMPIPTKFMQRYLADERGRRATLLSPLGKFWHIDLARDGGDVYFASGWAEFVKANKLEEENFLVFRYEGNMVFTMKVFDTSGCIRDYSNTMGAIACTNSGTVSSLEQTAPRSPGCGSQPNSKSRGGPQTKKTRKISERKLAGVDDILGGTQIKMPRKNRERKLAGDDDYLLKKRCKSDTNGTEENDDDQVAAPKVQPQADADPEIATEAKATDYTNTLPVYVKAATPCNIRYGYLNIGKKYCTMNGLVSNRLMILKDPEGRSWPVKLTLMSDQARMIAGWAHFATHHRLKVGDQCVFHLVDQQTFNVSIKRA